MVEEEQEPNLQAALETAEDADVQVDFSKKKKKKKKKAASAAQPAAQIEESKGFNWSIEGHKDYEYAELLDRIESIMNDRSNEADEEMNNTRGELP